MGCKLFTCGLVVVFVTLANVMGTDGMKDGTVTGFCNKLTNTTTNVALTNFVEVEYQCKDGPDQSTTFIDNTCQPTNLRAVGAVIAQCTTSGQPDNQQFNATIQCSFPVNRSTYGAEIIIISTGTTSHVTIHLDIGQCPSGAIVSSVPSGPGYNVTVETIKPNCSGWEEIVSYNFTIVCESNCTSGYTVSGNSSALVWVFPDVGSGVFTVTITAENNFCRTSEEGQLSKMGYDIHYSYCYCCSDMCLSRLCWCKCGSILCEERKQGIATLLCIWSAELL